MKKLLSIIVALIILSGCNKSNQFKIKLNLENADGQTIILVKSLDGKKPIIMDTAVIAVNKAVFDVSCDNPQAMYILAFKDAHENMILFPENQNVTVNGDMNDYIHIEATGSTAQNAFNDYQKGLAPFLELTPEKANKWMEENMFAKYPLGDLKDLKDGIQR